ncbi:MAG: C25 family cysteine peptidase [Dehalococcoidia bacterium]|nr:C25 family cysteine peptidase [Dehalococcoidia bacterium]
MKRVNRFFGSNVTRLVPLLLMLIMVSSLLVPATILAADMNRVDVINSQPSDLQPIDQTSGSPTVGVSKADSTGITIDIDIEGLEQEAIEIDGRTFELLSIPEYQNTEEVGKPQLPVVRKTIGIPDGATVQATVADASYSSYSGYMVYPAQKPLKDDEQPGEFALDEAFYSQDAFYPAEMVQVEEPAIWRDVTVVLLQVSPVRFNPATGELRVYDRIQVRLDYLDGLAAPKTVEPKFAQMYRQSLLNYDSLDITEGQPDYRKATPDASQLVLGGAEVDGEMVGGTPYDTSVKFLAILHNSCGYLSTLQPLLDWHRACGLNYTYVVRSGPAYTADDIKSIISGCYAAHPELEYVLLVGDITCLPWKDNWGGGALPEDLPGDYWYACLTGGATPDLYPDVAVGRLPVKNDTELAQQVTKILDYLKSPPTGDWANNALLMAHKEGPSTKYQKNSEDIRMATYGTDSFAFSTAYGASATYGGDDATNATVAAHLTSGVSIMNYRGHGAFGYPSTRPWGTFWGGQYGANSSAPWNTAGESYWTTDADALTNGDKLPVLFSISCMNNALDNSPDDCLGEAFVMQDQGAIAFLGASRPSYTTPNNAFDINLFDAIGNEGIYTVGWISNDANTELIDTYGPDSYAADNSRIYFWLGDPATEVWTSAPIGLNVTHPASVSTGIMSVTVRNASNVLLPNALVVIDGCGVYTWAYTNASGVATFNFIPDSTGTMKITVTKHNYVPYQGTTSIEPLTNKIFNIVFDPPSPASLCNGEKVFAEFDYTTTDEQGVLIFVRPYTGDDRTPGYGAHGSTVCPTPDGHESGWFTINSYNDGTSRNVTVDRVQFCIWSLDEDNKQDELLLELFVPVQFNYGYSIHNIVISPPSPATMKWDQNIEIEFDYYSCEDDGVHIFARPFTDGALTPKYTSSGSPDYQQGSGSGSGWFTIFDGEVTVDQLRFQMKHKDTDALLLELFVPVNYHYEGYPDLSVNPMGFDVDLTCGDSDIETLRISNVGGGSLHYKLRDRGATGGVALAAQSLGGTSMTVGVTDSASPDSDGAIIGEFVDSVDSQLDLSSLDDLSGVTIAFDLIHSDQNPSQLDMIKADLIERGASIVYLTEGPITEALLSPYDILWVGEDWNTPAVWTADEKGALQAWVQKGRGLLVYGDQPGGSSVLPSLFGITYTGTPGTSGYTTNILSHAITESVDDLYLPAPLQSLSAASPAYTVVQDHNGLPSIACAEPGSGRVVVIADDYFWGAYLEYGDNRLMANHVFDWLVPSDCPWLDETPKSGSIPTAVPNYDDITVQIDASSLTPGEYYAEICIASDDPDENPTIVPVHLTVLADQPDIRVVPPEFDLVVAQGVVAEYTLNIVNDAHCSNLEFELWDEDDAGKDCPWLAEAPTDGSVAPGSAQEIILSIDAAKLALGKYCAQIWIKNTDPDENPTIVPVCIEVVKPSKCKILFDESHAPADAAFTIGGGYSDWADLLRYRGMKVDKATTGPITIDLLGNYDAVVIPEPTQAYSKGEIDAIAQYVRGGGGVLLLGEWGSYAQDKGIYPVVNQIGGVFGLSFGDDVVEDGINNDGNSLWPLISQFDSAVVGDDVATVVEYGGCSFTLSGDAFAIARSGGHVLTLPSSEIPLKDGFSITSADASNLAMSEETPFDGVDPLVRGPIVMAASTLGEGRVAAIGDGNLFTNQDVDGDYLMDLYEYDNERIALNIIQWLTQCVVPANVEISVVLQGSSRPDAGWVIPLTVKFFKPGTSTLVAEFHPTTRKVGGAAVCTLGGVVPGTYDITVDSDTTLMNVNRGVGVSLPSTPVNMGTLLEGDADNSGTIDEMDFGILQAVFMTSDPSADFDRNGIVDIADFGLLAVNFMKTSPAEVP